MFEKYDRKAETAKHMAAPRVGDMFSEMFAFWVVVTRVWVQDGKHMIATMEASAPAALSREKRSLPDDGEQHVYTYEQFNERFAYGSGVKGYWIDYSRNIADTVDVASWYIPEDQHRLE